MTSSRFSIVIYTATVLLCSVFATARSFANPQTAPDNSGQNKDQTVTAENQSDTKADRETTAQARKAIMADKALSTYGHNVKIITRNGAVTLKGPVKSEEEKQRVASDIATVVSSDKITNILTVKKLP